MTINETQLSFLIQGCLKGNRLQQRELYEQFYGFGLKIALRYAMHREEAVEVLNDAFLKVFSKIYLYDAKYPFEVWLRRIIIHCAIDYHRKYHRIVETESLDQDGYLTTVADEEVHLTSEVEVLPIIQHLAPQYRMVFNLYVMEEYDHKSIAQLLNISESTSRANLSRAKIIVKKKLLEQNIHGKQVGSELKNKSKYG